MIQKFETKITNDIGLLHGFNRHIPQQLAGKNVAKKHTV
jgi:hypothetical protein